MVAETNRIEADLEVWRKAEERLERLFSGTLKDNIPFQRDKLSYYNGLSVKFGNTLDFQERMTLHALKQHMKDLEKRLYPNPLLRFLYRAIKPLLKNVENNRHQGRSMKAVAEVKDQLAKAGFQNYVGAVEQKMQQLQTAITVPITEFLSTGEKADIKLDIAMDSNGLYKFNGFRAAIDNAETGGHAGHYFSFAELGEVTSRQACNMLAGRPVAIEQIDNNGSKRNVWKQLDLTDQSSEGQFKIRQFGGNKELDIKSELLKLPLKSFSDLERNVQKLRQGDKVYIDLEAEGKIKKIVVEANVRSGILDLSDDRGGKRKVSPDRRSLSIAQKKVQPVRRRMQSKHNGI